VFQNYNVARRFIVRQNLFRVVRKIFPVINFLMVFESQNPQFLSVFFNGCDIAVQNFVTDAPQFCRYFFIAVITVVIAQNRKYAVSCR